MNPTLSKTSHCSRTTKGSRSHQHCPSVASRRQGSEAKGEFQLVAPRLSAGRYVTKGQTLRRSNVGGCSVRVRGLG